MSKASRFRFLSHAALAIGLGWPLLTSAPAVAGDPVIDAVFSAGTSGGVVGYRARRIGGAAYLSENAAFAFYPASTIKVLQHVAAMRYVEDGTLDLVSSPVDVCTATTNCGDAPNVTVASCMAAPKTLGFALVKMMVVSDNQDTNAIQELIGATADPTDPFPAQNGRDELFNLGAGLIGMSGATEIHHKFACGNVDNTPSNSATLLDFEILYHAIATRPEVLQPNTRVALKDSMRNETSSGFAADLLDIVDQEAAATFRSHLADAFRDRVYMVYKAGNVSNAGEYQSMAGLVQLPVYGGATKRLYTFGAFVEDADSYTDGTIEEASLEMLRPAVRGALLTWSPFPLAAPITALGLEVEGRIGQTGDATARALLSEASEHLRTAASGVDAGYATGEANWHFGHAAWLLDIVDRRAPKLGVRADLAQAVTLAGRMAESAVADAAAVGDAADLSARFAAVRGELLRVRGDDSLTDLERVHAFGRVAEVAARLRADAPRAEASPEAGFPMETLREKR